MSLKTRAIAVGPANDDQVRGTYLAYGISLDLSCDPRGSVDTWTSNAESPDQ